MTTGTLELVIVEGTAFNDELIHIECQHCKFCPCGVLDDGPVTDSEITCERCEYMDDVAQYRPVFCKVCGKDIGVWDDEIND